MIFNLKSLHLLPQDLNVCYWQGDIDTERICCYYVYLVVLSDSERCEMVNNLRLDRLDSCKTVVAAMINVIQTGLNHLHSYMSFSRNSEKPRLAFLGPLGTYSHQAALECFGDSVDYLARPTITGELWHHPDGGDQFSPDVQQALSAVVPLGIIPQENSINGSVVETYNVLRIPAVGQETFVRGVTVFAVNHALVTRRGVKLENIEKVLSHEQALAQCQGWLAQHLPQATLVPTDSTAGAAERLLSAENGLDSMKCAAICSSMVITIYEGLEILVENIQDRTENFTRFYILSQGSDTALPRECRSAENMAVLRIQSPGDPIKPKLNNISRIISTLDIIVNRIDRRPSMHGRPFDDVYFFEVSAGLERSTKSSWLKQVQQTVDEIKRMGTEVSALGYW